MLEQPYAHNINIDTLISFCTAKLQCNPKHRKALFIRASSLMKKHRHLQAIEDCHSLLSIDSRNVGAYYIIGCAHERLSQVQYAIENFSLVLELDPTHVNALLARGACFNRIGEYEQALNDYDTALRLDSTKSKVTRRRTDSRRKINEESDGRKTNQESQRNKDSMRGVEEEDLVNPYENKLRLLEINTSQFGNSQSVRKNQSTRSVQKIKASQDSQSQVNFSFQSKDSSMKQADNWHQRGWEARKKQDFNTAIQCYGKAIDLNPQHFKATFNRGFALDKIGETDLAIADYRRALEIEPKNAFCHYNLGISQDKQGRIEEAVNMQSIQLKDFSKAIEIDSTKADFFSNRAFTNRKLCKFSQAIADYTQAIDLNPSTFSLMIEHFKMYYYRALCYDKVNNYQAEQNDLKKVLQLNPNNANALYHLGLLSEKQGQCQKALEYLNQILASDPTFSAAYNAKGMIFDKLENYEFSLEEFTKAIRYDENNAVFYHNRGCCLKNMQQYEASIGDFKKALQLDPNNAVTYANIGLVYRKIQRFQQAIKAFSKQIELEGKTYPFRAYCSVRMGQYAEAVKDYTAALESEVDNLQYLHNRGVCYERMHDYDKAIKDFTRQIELSHCSTSYFIRGYCYDSIGQLELALKDYSTALQK